MKLHGFKKAEVGRRLGVSGQYISMLLSGKSNPSNQLVLALDRLEQQLDDPFLAACTQILNSDNERVVEGFTMNIYSVLGNIDQKEAKRLKEIEEDYLEERRAKRRTSKISDAG